MNRLPSERYQLAGPEKEGGFGRVIRAHDLFLQRDVAIKILDPLLQGSATYEGDRFLNEARVLARLSHASIPAIYDIVFAPTEPEPVFQIVFQFIPGPTLAENLVENGPASVEQARRWFGQLASALAHAHSEGVIHRDIKPDNIIIRASDDTCCLVDWGIALSKDESTRLTESGYVVGTPGYMSPEQQRGEPLDSRSDIWNLGICLYEVLAGRTFPLGTYVTLSSLNEAIPQAIDELIQSCIAETASRFADVRDFERRLNEALIPRAGLSDVLIYGTLADLQTSIAALTPTEFAGRPAGQRALVFAKIADIAASNEERLEMAVSRLLETLVRVATEVPIGEYGEIWALGLEWAFVHEYRMGGVGLSSLRRQMAETAVHLNSNLYKGAAKSTVDFFTSQDLSAFEDWRLNGARELVSGLLANRACEEEASELASLRREVDAQQRAR